MSLNKKRIGIFGGTFNPIHYGHLIIAENARTQYNLEQVIFLPTGHSPHKTFMGEDMSIHRCRMVEAAIADNPYFSISYREIQNASVNYTYRTLEKIRQENPETDLYFILGADSLFDFDLWRHPELICRYATILAAVRDYLNEQKVDDQIQYLRDKYQGIIYRLDTPNFNVSSKGIRERIQNEDTIRYMVPERVEQYIQDNHLYREVPMKYKEIQKDLKKKMKPARYQHTMGVVKTAEHLARIYDTDVSQASLAALLHDCAKHIDDGKKVAMCREYGVSVTDAEMANPSLLHAKCGAIVAEYVYGIIDTDILHAIRVHTTGVPDMNLLDKIIFVSDYIEPNRDKAPHLDELRRLADRDLNETTYRIMKDTVDYLNQRSEQMMDPTTKEAYQYYAKLCKGE